MFLKEGSWAWTTLGCSIAVMPFPVGGHLEQADGTAWMALFCQKMAEIAVELAATDPSYEEFSLKFSEHFLWIAAAINKPGEVWTMGRRRRFLL